MNGSEGIVAVKSGDAFCHERGNDIGNLSFKTECAEHCQ